MSKENTRKKEVKKPDLTGLKEHKEKKKKEKTIYNDFIKSASDTGEESEVKVKSEESEEESEVKAKSKEKVEVVKTFRKGYYLEKETVKAIKRASLDKEKTYSEIVEEALKSGLDSKYFKSTN